MPIDKTKIRYVYSGDGSSTSPQLSIGGTPSLQYVTGTNLFNNVSANQALTGRVDYRCVYLVNENASDSLFATTVSMYYDAPGDVTVDFGFIFQNERQYIFVGNFTEGTTTGSFDVKYTNAQGNSTFTVNADTITNMTASVLSGMESALGAGNATVTGGQIPGNPLTFQVDFVTKAGNRFHDIMETLNITLSNPSNPQPTATVQKTSNGSPVNSEADSIDIDTTAPNNVTFDATDAALGEMKGLDIIPIWIRRTIPAGSGAIETDGFILRVAGTLFED